MISLQGMLSEGAAKNECTFPETSSLQDGDLNAADGSKSFQEKGLESGSIEDSNTTKYHEADGSENALLLPTAEDCANQLASILNCQSISDAKSLPQSEEIEKSPQRSKGISFATPRKKSSANDVQIVGSGNDIFEMKISIENHHDLCQLLVNTSTPTDRNVWLSYRFFGTVFQSDIFTISKSPQRIDDFTPMTNTFRVRGSWAELAEHFNERENAALRVHLCTAGEVLCTSFVELRQLFAVNQECNRGSDRHCDFEGRIVQNEYILQPCNARTKKEGSKKESQPCNGSPQISVRLCIDRLSAVSDSIGDTLTSTSRRPVNYEQQQSPTVFSSKYSQTLKRTSVNRASSPMKDATPPEDDHGDNDVSHSFQQLEEREKQLNARETEITRKEKQAYEAFASLEKKRCEWEQWRHRQELEWHGKLQNKEAAMMRIIEERVCTIEKERLRSVEASKSEYEKLESRLRKALIEVAAKERQLKDIELGLQNEQKRKLAEIELREKLMKEELKHSVEIERAKVNAAVDQAVAAEKAAAAAGKRVKQVEAEMDQLREHHRKTPEVTLMHQVAELKGQLADSERRIEAMNLEKNQVSAEKERFRADVHKLARALRKERERAMANQHSNNHQEVRLGYDEHDKSFVLAGGQDEIHRILADLNKISQIKGQGCQSSMMSPMREYPVPDNINVPPIPSPPPSHPIYNCTSATQNVK